MKKLLILIGMCLVTLVGCANRYPTYPNQPLIQDVPIDPTNTTNIPIGSPSPNGAEPLVDDVNMHQAQ